MSKDKALPGRVWNRRTPWACALIFLFAVVWLAPLGSRALISSDEGRYATLSLAMLQSGDWVTPRLNGLLYFEKPPLQYWIGAASMAVFGINEFAARFWPGLSGLITVALVGFTARRLWGATSAFYAFCIAGSSTWTIANSHFLSLDSGLCAALTLVLCAVLLAEHDALQPHERRRWFLAAWVGLALAVLSKGLIGILIPLASLILASAWRRDAAIWRRLQWAQGLPLLLMITAPWFILVSMRNPPFAHFFFIHEHVERYLSTSHHRTGVWWYFFPYLLLGFLPWTGSLPWLARMRRPDFAQTLFWTWAAFTFVFFSASQSKLPSYILPMFPALALLLARRMPDVSAAALRRHLLLPAAIWLVLLMVSTQRERFATPETPVAAIAGLVQAVAVAAASSLLAYGIAWQLLRQNRIAWAVGLVSATHLICLLALLQSHDRFGQLKSSATIARELAPWVQADTPVFAVAAYDQTLPFYLRRPVTLVAYRDEFEFGENIEPPLWLPTIESFVTRWSLVPHAAAYMAPETYEQLRAAHVPMHVVYRDPRRTVVIKP